MKILQNILIILGQGQPLRLIALLILIFQFSIVHAYKIELTNPHIADIPVFIAGYYGNQVFIVDSTKADANGYAILERNYDLSTGMYTLLVPSIVQYDLLIDDNQLLHFKWSPDGVMRIEGDEKATAWAEYQAWMENQTDRDKIVEHRRQIIAKYPDTFLAAYLLALQPVESPSNFEKDTMNYNIGFFMNEYRYQRRHYFANMPLSDVRFLHTPLYHEKVYNYLIRFVVQNADSLIFIAYSMLEQSLGNYETFFYISDFVNDFAQRYRHIKDINKFHAFVRRNREVLGSKGIEALQPKFRADYFALSNEVSLKNRFFKKPFTDPEGQTFNPTIIKNKYHLYFFWKNNCAKCLVEIPRLITVLDKYEKLIIGVAVNIEDDIRKPENRIETYNPVCLNLSIADMPYCQKVFFVNYYSKIVLTDNDGNIVGIFTSIAALDSFLRIARL